MEPVDSMTFPDQLRAERRRLGLTQPKLAKILGVSLESVSIWERRVSLPLEITQEGALARLAKLKP